MSYSVTNFVGTTQRTRLAAAYVKGFDAYLTHGETATSPYSRADYRKWWEMGRADAKDNKRPRFGPGSANSLS